mmetsp:Transcript_79621/g.234156  ORF Transcript_79621/g.234156 Transcript_79621/m.234156 type:complete len:149 (-) Transcript_79621:148-594(-)
MGATCCHEPAGNAEPVAVQTCSVGGKPEPILKPARADPEEGEDPAAEPKQPEAAEAPPDGSGRLFLTFQKPSGEDIEVVVTRKPLGVDFKKKMPLQVKTVRPKSIGAELNIEEGWTISKVNGEDIQALDFQPVYEKLKRGLNAIPDAA